MGVATASKALQQPQETPSSAIATPLTAATKNARSLVDVLLFSLMEHRGTAIWFSPLDDLSQPRSHRVILERQRTPIASMVLGAGLGDAVLARLALLARLDLLVAGVQNGRVRVRLGAACLELLVTMRLTGGGLGGELRVLDSVGQSLDTEEATQPDGTEYPEILEAGTRVGPYRIERTLGRGGMGMVYRVEHTQLRKSFAMKVLHRSVLAKDPDAARRFVREARAAARVQHGGIVDVSDFGSFADGRHYLVMELLAGHSLFDLIATQGAIEPARALRLMRDAASALGAAHAAGIVHRDVSPSNIFLETANGAETVKIVDFGAASLPELEQQDLPDAPEGVVVGTPYYMSPEQIRGGPRDARSDMYSFGVVLYELVSGRVPFDGDSAREVALKHLRDPVPALFSKSAGGVPEPLWLVIERLLAKKPDDRYPTTNAVIAELDRVFALLQRKGWRKWLPV